MNAQVKETPNEASETGTAIVEFKPTEVALAQLRHDYGSLVLDVSKPDQMQIAIKARAELCGFRTGLEKIRADLKAPVLAMGRKIDAEAAKITAELLKLEQPIDGLIKAEQARKENEKRIREEAEAKRISDINEKIDTFNGIANSMIGRSPAALAARLAEVREMSTDFADEYQPTADNAKARATAALEQLLAGAMAQEKQRAEEAERRLRDEAELARLKKADEERQAEERRRAGEEQQRIVAENKKRAEEEEAHRKKLEEEERASRARIAAEEKAARDQREKEEAAAREKRAAADAQAKAEQDRRDAIEREAKAKRDAEEKRQAEERAKIEAETREIERKKAELLDAEHMLATFVEKFGHLEQFGGVVKAIKALKAKPAPKVAA